MKIAKTVRVLGEVYKVRLAKGLIEREQAEGLCCPYTYTISIDASLIDNPRAFLKCYWHEVGHAFAFESGLHDSLSPQACEMFAQAFSNFVCKLK